MANGKSTPQACKEAGIHTQTYYRWRKEYGGLKVEQAKRMKELETQEEPIANVVDRVAEALGAGPHLDFNHFMAVVETDISEHGVKLTAKRNKLLQTSLAARAEVGETVIKKIHKPGRMEPDPIRGLVESTVKGKCRVVAGVSSVIYLRRPSPAPLASTECGP